ncbi:hypothetical protein SprV_0100360800 [Sparganum proliferum]
MFLGRLPIPLQTLLATGSDDLDISRLDELAGRIMEVDPPPPLRLPKSCILLSASTSSYLAGPKAQIAHLCSRTALTTHLEIPQAKTVVAPTLALGVLTSLASAIRYIDGSRKEVAGAPSRSSIAHLQLSSRIDLSVAAVEQRRDEDVSKRQRQDFLLTTRNGDIICDVSTASQPHFGPPSHRRKASSSLQNFLTLGVELPTIWFLAASSGLGCTRT